MLRFFLLLLFEAVLVVVPKPPKRELCSTAESRTGLMLQRVIAGNWTSLACWIDIPTLTGYEANVILIIVKLYTNPLKAASVRMIQQIFLIGPAQQICTTINARL